MSELNVEHVSPVVFGKLFYNKDFNSLKCLIACLMSGKNVELEEVTTPVKQSAHEAKCLSFVSSEDGQRILYDPFSIVWVFSSPIDQQLQESTPAPETFLLQWNSFSQSEIRPFLLGLLHHSFRNPSRNVIFANKRRRNRLSSGLDVLNAITSKQEYLLGSDFSMADAILAVDLMPLLGFPLVHLNPLLRDLMKNKRWFYLKKWYEASTSHPYFVEGCKHLNLSPLITKLYTGASTNPDGGDAGFSLFKSFFNRRRFVKRRQPEQQSGDSSGKDENSTAITPLKILCLHGYRQNENTFREKTGAFRKAISKFVDLTYITAPHRVLPMSNEDINQDQRGWWFSRESDFFNAGDVSDCCKGFDESLDLIKETFDLKGPFDGIMGFSQGAALCALLCLMQAKCPDLFPDFVKFKFAILFAGFRSRSSHHSCWYDKTDPAFNMISLPSLHVIGDEDRVIPKKMSREIVGLFEKSSRQVLRHKGGHFIPVNSREKQAYISFLSQMQMLCSKDENHNVKPLKVAVHPATTSEEEETVDA